MAWSYFGYQRIDPAAPWAQGVTYLAAEDQPIEGKLAGLKHTAARIRLLPADETSETLIQSLRTLLSPSREMELRARLSEKLVWLAPEREGLEKEQLASGRLPVAGRAEILAGWQTSRKDRLVVEDQTLTVVGVLKPDAAMLADSYLVPPHESVAGLFDSKKPGVRSAILLSILPSQAGDPQLGERLRAELPKDRFTRVAPNLRVQRGPYYLYLAGQALLLLGGCGALIALYAAWAARASWRMLKAPLEEMVRRRRLLRAVHLGYFGLMIAAALAIYELPAFQYALLGLTQSELTEGSGVLAIAAKAYGTRNMLVAAAVTFAINYALGSLIYITLPSIVVPGAGVLPAALRATLWGLVLAPTVVALSAGMLAHSLTLLLEGEAYVLATFFGLLVPIYLFQPAPGETLGRRYVRALILNLKGSLLVALVLLVAAGYEAVEVILMMR